MPPSTRRWLTGCCAAPGLLVLVAIACLIVARRPLADPVTEPASLAEALDTAREHYRLPGLAAAYITADSIETAASGVVRQGSTERATPEMYWHIGSNSKAITATLAGLLRADGLLEAATTPEQLWPQEAGAVHAGYRGVTLLDLLTHRAGVPPYTAGSEFEGLPDFPGDTTARARAFTEHVLSHPPGGKRGAFLYSNAGYAIAGAMLSAASGEPFDALLEERLFGPLGIDCIAGWPVTQGAAQPSGHYELPWGGRAAHDPADGYVLDDFMAPAGDLALPMPDYARFVQLHLRGLRGLPPVADPALAKKVPGLTAKLIQELHEPVGDYACGWGCSGTVDAPRSAHEGSLGTFHAITVISPAQDRAVVVVTNCGGDKAEAALHWVAEAVLE